MTLFANIIPYGISDNDFINGFCTNLADPTFRIYGALEVFAFALAFAGLLQSAYRTQMGGDLSSLGTQLIMIALVSISLTYAPVWILNSDVHLGVELMDTLGLNPKSALDTLTKNMADVTVDTLISIIAEVILLGFLGVGLGFVGFAIVSILLLAISWVFVGLCWAAVLIAFFVQIAVVYVALALLPIFLGMLLFDVTKDSGVKYIMGIIGVMFWPLGWALGLAVVNETIPSVYSTLFHSSATSKLQIANIALGGIISASFGIVMSGFFWSVIKTAPKLISAAITTGAQVAGGMISGGATAGFSTAAGVGAAAASAGAMAATGGGSAAVGGGAALTGGGMSMGQK